MKKLIIIFLLLPVLLFGQLKTKVEPGLGGMGSGVGFSHGGYSVLLPKKLIISPDVYTEEMDTTTGWTATDGTVAVNNSEIHSGTGSLKLTSTVGGAARIQKNVVLDWSNDNGKSLGVWIYPHSAPITTFSSVYLFVAFTGGFSNYGAYIFQATDLLQNTWNYCSVNLNEFGMIAGTANWSDVTILRLTIITKAGQTAECSFDLLGEGNIRKPSIMLMFDDNNGSVYNKAFPLVKAKNMVATNYIISSGINGGPNLTTNQIQEMYNNGWDIGNHSETHADLSTLTQAGVETELNNCKLFLDGIGLTRASNHVAYPGGSYNNTVLAAMGSWGAKTGRKNMGVGGVNVFDGNWPYTISIRFTNPAISLDQIKTIIDNAITQGSVAIGFHILVDSDEAIDNDWLTSKFSGLLDYIESLGLQTLTIDEYYRLYSDSIVVHHK